MKNNKLKLFCCKKSTIFYFFNFMYSRAVLIKTEEFIIKEYEYLDQILGKFYLFIILLFVLYRITSINLKYRIGNFGRID